MQKKKYFVQQMYASGKIPGVPFLNVSGSFLVWVDALVISKVVGPHNQELCKKQERVIFLAMVELVKYPPKLYRLGRITTVELVGLNDGPNWFEMRQAQTTNDPGTWIQNPIFGLDIFERTGKIRWWTVDPDFPDRMLKVTEGLNGYYLTHVPSGRTACMGPLDDDEPRESEEGDIEPGTPEFLDYWQEIVDRSAGEYLEAYFPEKKK